MKILVIGATGTVGKAYASEAVHRGHEVTSAARNPGTDARLRHVRLDVLEDKDRLETLVERHDATLSAVRPIAGDEEALVTMTRTVLEAARTTGRRVYVTGGAGPLLLADGSGHTVLSAPDFLPASIRPIAQACARQDTLLDAFDDVDWVCLRPAALLLKEERTGRYALGRDALVVQADGVARISYADFAVAMLDLVELAPRPRQRLTVGW